MFTDEEKEYVLLAYYLGRKKLLNCIALHQLTKDLLDAFEFEGSLSFCNSQSSNPVAGCCLCKEKENIFKDFLEYYFLKEGNAECQEIGEKDVERAWSDVLQLWKGLEKCDGALSGRQLILNYEKAGQELMKTHDVRAYASMKKKYSDLENFGNWSRIIRKVQVGLQSLHQALEKVCDAEAPVQAVRKVPNSGESVRVAPITINVQGDAPFLAKYAMQCRAHGIEAMADSMTSVKIKYMICLKCSMENDYSQPISVMGLHSKYFTTSCRMYQGFEEKLRRVEHSGIAGDGIPTTRNGGFAPNSDISKSISSVKTLDLNNCPLSVRNTNNIPSSSLKQSAIDNRSDTTNKKCSRTLLMESSGGSAVSRKYECSSNQSSFKPRQTKSVLLESNKPHKKHDHALFKVPNSKLCQPRPSKHKYSWMGYMTDNDMFEQETLTDTMSQLEQLERRFSKIRELRKSNHLFAQQPVPHMPIMRMFKIHRPAKEESWPVCKVDHKMASKSVNTPTPLDIVIPKVKALKWDQISLSETFGFSDFRLFPEVCENDRSPPEVDSVSEVQQKLNHEAPGAPILCPMELGVSGDNYLDLILKNQVKKQSMLRCLEQTMNMDPPKLPVESNLSELSAESSVQTAKLNCNNPDAFELDENLHASEVVPIVETDAMPRNYVNTTEEDSLNAVGVTSNHHMATSSCDKTGDVSFLGSISDSDQDFDGDANVIQNEFSTYVAEYLAKLVPSLDDSLKAFLTRRQKTSTKGKTEPTKLHFSHYLCSFSGDAMADVLSNDFACSKMVRYNVSSNSLAQHCDWAPKTLTRVSRLILHEQILLDKQAEIKRRSNLKGSQKKSKPTKSKKWKSRFNVEKAHADSASLVTEDNAFINGNEAMSGVSVPPALSHGINLCGIPDSEPPQIGRAGNLSNSECLNVEKEHADSVSSVTEEDAFISGNEAISRVSVPPALSHGINLSGIPDSGPPQIGGAGNLNNSECLNVEKARADSASSVTEEDAFINGNEAISGVSVPPALSHGSNLSGIPDSGPPHIGRTGNLNNSSHSELPVCRDSCKDSGHELVKSITEFKPTSMDEVVADSSSSRCKSITGICKHSAPCLEITSAQNNELIGISICSSNIECENVYGKRARMEDVASHKKRKCDKAELFDWRSSNNQGDMKSIVIEEHSKPACQNAAFLSSSEELTIRYKRDSDGNWKSVNNSTKTPNIVKLPTLIPRSAPTSEFQHKLCTLSRHRPPSKMSGRNHAAVRNAVKSYMKSNDRRKKSRTNSCKSLLFSSSYLPSFEQIGFIPVQPNPSVFAGYSKMKELSQMNRARIVSGTPQLLTKPHDARECRYISNVSGMSVPEAHIANVNPFKYENDCVSNQSKCVLPSNVEKNILRSHMYKDVQTFWKKTNKLHISKMLNSLCPFISAQNAEFAVSALTPSLVITDNSMTRCRSLPETNELDCNSPMAEPGIAGCLPIGDACSQGTESIDTFHSSKTEDGVKSLMNRLISEGRKQSTVTEFDSCFVNDSFNPLPDRKSIQAAILAESERCKGQPQHFDESTVGKSMCPSSRTLWKPYGRLSTALKFYFTNRKRTLAQRHYNNKLIWKNMVSRCKFNSKVEVQRSIKMSHFSLKKNSNQMWWKSLPDALCINETQEELPDVHSCPNEKLPSDACVKWNQNESKAISTTPSCVNTDVEPICSNKNMSDCICSQLHCGQSSCQRNHGINMQKLNGLKECSRQCKTHYPPVLRGVSTCNSSDGTGYCKVMSRYNDAKEQEAMQLKGNKRKQTFQLVDNSVSHKRMTAILNADAINMQRYARYANIGDAEQNARCLQPLFESSLNIHLVSRALYDSANAKSFSFVPPEFSQNSPIIFQLGNQMQANDDRWPFLAGNESGSDERSRSDIEHSDDALVSLEQCQSITSKRGRNGSHSAKTVRQTQYILRYKSRPCIPKGLGNVRLKRLMDMKKRANRRKNVGIRTNKCLKNNFSFPFVDRAGDPTNIKGIEVLDKIAVICIPRCEVK